MRDVPYISSTQGSIIAHYYSTVCSASNNNPFHEADVLFSHLGYHVHLYDVYYYTPYYIMVIIFFYCRQVEVVPPCPFNVVVLYI